MAMGWVGGGGGVCKVSSKMTHNQLWICCKNFFKILQNEKDQWVDESNNGLYQKKLFRTNRSFWAFAHLHNSGLALTIFLKFCRMKGANR